MKETTKKIIYLIITLSIMSVGCFTKMTKGLEMPIEENRALVIMTIVSALLSAIWLTEISLLLKEKLFPQKMRRQKKRFKHLYLLNSKGAQMSALFFIYTFRYFLTAR
ncbi:hypothetical protein A2996_01250 [Candidatus Campbellbacteria bacterium RIFCSPLOWO2_01_FULL_34_15]|uniref:Lipoprotein n=2 Tax=Candidatus Campbelliibacteriota TaxID=1752727 RepID=A0A1F5EP60_9BACT|nr:MAG: hypothetical protein A2811_01450 [Candidatus Campbellbacteria bacterium RIFCSPHIGHO2_01_FULL_34_10]OGD69173.1 MAG: hypothetical protein A2996_01250 [Candidatus Campbellbacteria bacterium RIFCSPLOWO2_01_FULL_34_15]